MCEQPDDADAEQSERRRFWYDREYYDIALDGDSRWVGIDRAATVGPQAAAKRSELD